MHLDAFEYIAPNPEQEGDMCEIRTHFVNLTKTIERLIPIGPDRTYIIRKLRECNMWCAVAIMQDADGKARG